MTVLTANVGSNSLKLALVSAGAEQGAAHEGRILESIAVDAIGGKSKLLRFLGKDVVHEEGVSAGTYEEAAKGGIRWLRENAAAFAETELVAHRVVHGADAFSGPAAIDGQVLARIEELEGVAPLHNRAAVAVIRSLAKDLPAGMPAFAVFDTLFHRDLPPVARTYALPWDMMQRFGIRRYGFHGLSHEYMVHRYAGLTGVDPQTVSLVTLHLEGGCSACAVKNGRSIDTTMGFTPLEGLMMGKRAGDVDPGIFSFLHRKEGLGPEAVDELLNRQSGLLGVSGLSNDTRVLVPEVDRNPQVRLAMEMFCYRIRKSIGAYLAALDGAEAVVFGGGIGEDDPWTRAEVCRGLGWLGLELDEKVNRDTINREACISTKESRIAAWVITSEESLQLAHMAVRSLVGETKRVHV